MKFFVYVIEEKESKKRYIGYTSDIDKRLDRHNHKLPNKSTSYTSKNKGVWSVIYTEDFLSRQDAMKREKELKSSRGRFFLKNKLG